MRSRHAHVIPPPQANQAAPGHILDGPEVQCKQRNDDDKVQHKVVADEEAKQIRQHSAKLEQHVEVHRLGVPGGDQA